MFSEVRTDSMVCYFVCSLIAKENLIANIENVSYFMKHNQDRFGPKGEIIQNDA